MIGQRIVSLVSLAHHAETPAKVGSIYRFFAFCALRGRTIGKLIEALSPQPADACVKANAIVNGHRAKSVFRQASVLSSNTS